MFEPERMPLLILGLLSVAIGLAIFLLDIHRRANRAFGAIATLRGLTFVATGLFAAAYVERTGALFAMGPYLLLPIVPLAFYFWSVFPERRGPLAFNGSGWLVLSFTGLLWLIYAINHSTVYSIAPGASGSGFQNAAPGWVVTGFGPLSLFVAGFPLALSVLGLLYAWEYVKHPGSRQLHAIVASGFILNGIFDGGLAAAGLLNDPSVFSLTGYALAFPILRALALIPAAVALGMVISTHNEESGPSRIRWVLPALAVLALISGPIPILMGISGYGLTWHSLIILSLWRLVMPVTVGYALIRSGMLDHVRLPHLWPRGSKAARPTVSVRSTED